jgi:hypothetical protein
MINKQACIDCGGNECKAYYIDKNKYYILCIECMCVHYITGNIITRISKQNEIGHIHWEDDDDVISTTFSKFLEGKLRYG